MISLSAGDTESLTAMIDPLNATVKTVLWTSSNDSVAVVGINGTVTAIADGRAVITAKSVDVDVYGLPFADTCEVIVFPKVPTPQATVLDAPEASSLSVALSCGGAPEGHTCGPACPTIYYTTNNAEPTNVESASNFRYSYGIPLSISTDTYVKAKGFQSFVDAGDSYLGQSFTAAFLYKVKLCPR